MKLLSVNNISKDYNEKKVLRNISFDVEQEGFVSIFGPNASGKTTFLNIIAGLTNADSGTVEWSDESLKSKVSYVFQNYRETLFPWKNIAENITLPLKLAGVSPSDRKHKVEELLSRFSLVLDLKRYPYQLSGGQQQLVAILRAIITEPALLLLDEPFSALDFPRRLNLQGKVLDIWEQTKTTVIFISHDIDEAIFMADNVVLLGNKPTQVEINLPIEIERPRKPEYLTTEKFIAYKKQLLSTFMINEVLTKPTLI